MTEADHIRTAAALLDSNTLIAWVCADCGDAYGRRPEGNRHATWHVGTCGVCGTQAWCTEPRDYGYLKRGSR